MNTGREPVPGTIVKQWEIPAREYLALEMKAGQVLRIVDLDGQQVPDLVCFNRHDLTERLNDGNSMLLNRAWLFKPGHALYSDDCSKMMTLLTDTAGMNFAITSSFAFNCGPRTSSIALIAASETFRSA